METNIIDKNLIQVKIGDTILSNNKIFKIKYGNYIMNGVKRIGVYAESNDKKQLSLTSLRNFEIF